MLTNEKMKVAMPAHEREKHFEYLIAQNPHHVLENNLGVLFWFVKDDNNNCVISLFNIKCF